MAARQASSRPQPFWAAAPAAQALAPLPELRRRAASAGRRIAGRTTARPPSARLPRRCDRAPAADQVAPLAARRGRAASPAWIRPAVVALVRARRCRLGSRRSRSGSGRARRPVPAQARSMRRVIAALRRAVTIPTWSLRLTRDRGRRRRCTGRRRECPILARVPGARSTCAHLPGSRSCGTSFGGMAGPQNAQATDRRNEDSGPARNRIDQSQAEPGNRGVSIGPRSNRSSICIPPDASR